MNNKVPYAELRLSPLLKDSDSFLGKIEKLLLNRKIVVRWKKINIVLILSLLLVFTREPAGLKWVHNVFQLALFRNCVILCKQTINNSGSHWLHRNSWSLSDLRPRVCSLIVFDPLQDASSETLMQVWTIWMEPVYKTWSSCSVFLRSHSLSLSLSKCYVIIVLFDDMSNHFRHVWHHFMEFSVVDHSVPIEIHLCHKGLQIKIKPARQI